jgi:protocatechuate 3,4-dioxygenase alpha subunit
VGPYFGIALTADGANELVADGTPGFLVVWGSLSDAASEPVREGMLEIWQADVEGRYPESDTGFTGFGRCHIDDEGRFEFRTVKPGRVPGRDRTIQAPHINVSVYGAGLLKPARTRIYFSDEADANAADPVLSGVDPTRRRLLIAEVQGNRARFDIKLQGDDETPFFDA